MFKSYKLIGMVVLAMTMPICLSAQPKQDTAIYLSDGTGKAINATVSAYAAKKWKEGNLWHLQVFFFPESTLKQDGLFSDPECKKKEGVFIRYYSNGMMQDSGRFVNDKQEGTHTSWFDTGDPEGIEHFKDGHYIDTSVNWNKNGTKSRIVIVDKNGTGIEQGYDDSGKIRVKGKLELGKREGGWTFTDNNQIVSQFVVYEMDSVMAITNFDENGKRQENGVTKVEIPAEFPGGLNGWRRFLERNLNYPESAQRHGTQGAILIQFVVGRDGTPSDIKVLGNPDKDLAKEAKRIMNLSPKWTPAIQYNRRVTYRFIQTITFQLQ